MANWKALTWSESLKTGKQAARHVLTVLCMKCDDDYRVFSDAARLAGFCELSTRRIYGWLDYLEERGLVTVIRRVRPNGSEAKPITLLNVPDAPHLNGKPVVLDYGGKYLYPREPNGLRRADIRWVSAGEVGRTHPSHAAPVDQGDDSSACQGDGLAGCMTSTDGDQPEVGQRDESSGRQHDDSSPHGGDELSPPNQSPPEAFPSNQPGEDGSSGDVARESGNAGGLVEEKPHKQLTPGTAFLRELVLPNGRRLTEDAIQAEAPHVDALLASNWGPQELADTVLDAAGVTVRSWPAFVRGKLRKQQPKQQQQAQPAMSSWPGWCGECDKENRRYMGEDGRLYRCPACHPRSVQPQALKLTG